MTGDDAIDGCTLLRPADTHRIPLAPRQCGNARETHRVARGLHHANAADRIATLQRLRDEQRNVRQQKPARTELKDGFAHAGCPEYAMRSFSIPPTL